MYNPNYEFCSELDAPELCIIMNNDWWQKNRDAIIEWIGADPKDVGMNGAMLFIKEPERRTYFMLRWPQ